MSFEQALPVTNLKKTVRWCCREFGNVENNKKTVAKLCWYVFFKSIFYHDKIATTVMFTHYFFIFNLVRS